MRSFIKALACLSLASLTLAGCPGETGNDLRTGMSFSNPEVQVDAKPSLPGGVIDVGNGVYYFDSTRADFARSLSEFIVAHPDLALVAMTGDGNSDHGRDRGYFVVFRQK
jgi:hypothetical protein